MSKGHETERTVATMARTRSSGIGGVKRLHLAEALPPHRARRGTERRTTAHQRPRARILLPATTLPSMLGVTAHVELFLRLGLESSTMARKAARRAPKKAQRATPKPPRSKKSAASHAGTPIHQTYEELDIGAEQVTSNECWVPPEEHSPGVPVYGALRIGREQVTSNECYDVEDT